jgi:hypothetical protein
MSEEILITKIQDGKKYKLIPNALIPLDAAKRIFKYLSVKTGLDSLTIEDA